MKDFREKLEMLEMINMKFAGHVSCYFEMADGTIALNETFLSNQIVYNSGSNVKAYPYALVKNFKYTTSEKNNPACFYLAVMPLQLQNDIKDTVWWPLSIKEKIEFYWNENLRLTTHKECFDELNKLIKLCGKGE